MNYDWIGWALGVIGILYAVYTDRRAKQRRDDMHSFLVGLKPSIQGSNKDAIIAAINDELQKLQK